MKNSRSTSLNLCLFFMAWFGLPVLNATAQTTNHTCGAPDMHNESLTYGQVSDIDGNSYKTIIIDDLIWFAENLKVTRFQNGDAIPNVTDSAAWASLSGPGRCSYQNDSSFDAPKESSIIFMWPRMSATLVLPVGECPKKKISIS